MSYKDYIKKIVALEQEAINDTNDPFIIKDPKNDWDKERTDETIKPEYNDNYKDYTVSLKDIISGINSTKYKINGSKIYLPDKDGNLISLPDWIGTGGSGGGGAKPNKQYRVEMISTQGNIIKDKNFTTILKAIVYEDNIDITADTDKRYFKWSRISGATEKDQELDAIWNLKWAEGAKEIPITAEDVNRNAVFQVQFVTEKDAVVWETNAIKTYTRKVKI